MRGREGFEKKRVSERNEIIEATEDLFNAGFSENQIDALFKMINVMTALNEDLFEQGFTENQIEALFRMSQVKFKYFPFECDD